jgi:hypothetical protein
MPGLVDGLASGVSVNCTGWFVDRRRCFVDTASTAAGA